MNKLAAKMEDAMVIRGGISFLKGKPGYASTSLTSGGSKNSFTSGTNNPRYTN
ncbi:unnamed protein product [Prunus armeniaca]